MRSLLTLLLACALTGTAAMAQEDAKEFVNGPKIEFDKLVHDFGENPQGTPVAYEFIFKNNGNEPLVLQNVKASCGCTTPFWPKEPIMPGQESNISVKYNMARAGNFTKTITVTVKPKTPEETPETIKLTIKGAALAAAPDNPVEEITPTLITNPKSGGE